MCNVWRVGDVSILESQLASSSCLCLKGSFETQNAEFVATRECKEL